MNIVCCKLIRGSSSKDRLIHIPLLNAVEAADLPSLLLQHLNFSFIMRLGTIFMSTLGPLLLHTQVSRTVPIASLVLQQDATSLSP